MSLCGIKMRAWPTSFQKWILSQWMGCARFVYNGKCEEQEYFFRFKCRFPELVGERVPVDQTYSQFKTEASSFLNQCPSEILRNSAVIWYRAMQSFFSGIAGKPVRKQKGNRESIWLTQELFQLKKNEQMESGLYLLGRRKTILGF